MEQAGCGAFQSRFCQKHTDIMKKLRRFQEQALNKYKFVRHLAAHSRDEKRNSRAKERVYFNFVTGITVGSRKTKRLETL